MDKTPAWEIELTLLSLLKNELPLNSGRSRITNYLLKVYANVQIGLRAAMTLLISNITLPSL